MQHRRQRLISTASQRPAFALIIAISLMAFILLLLLSLTAIVQVESASADRHVQQELARSNARYAAMVALGQLQKLAGRDQRVTARGDILDATVADGGTVTRPYLTGVWQTNAAGLQGDPVWLVSGNPQNFGDTMAVTPLTPSMASDVTLVGAATVTDTTAEVRVPVEPVQQGSNQVVGNFAWWVSDEGLKANTLLSDPHQASATERIHSSQVSQTNHLQTLPEMTDFSVDETLYSRVVDFKQLPLIGAGTDTGTSRDMGKLFHTVSLYSRGLLVDTRDGGLRKDLTPIFEDPSDLLFNNYLNSSGTDFKRFLIDTNTAPLDGVGTPVSFFVANSDTGPKWSNLRAFYNLYKGLSGQASDMIRIPGSNWANFNVWSRLYRAQGGANHVGVQHPNNPLFPVFARMQLGVGVEFVDAAVPPQKKPILTLRPLIALYNPYNVRLNAREYYIEWEAVAGWSGSSTDPGAMRVTLTNTSGGSYPSFKVDRDLMDNKFNNKFFWKTPAVDFEPGETRLFSMASTVDYNAIPGGSSPPQHFELIADIDLDGKFTWDVNAELGTNYFWNSGDGVELMVEFRGGQLRLKDGPNENANVYLQSITGIFDDFGQDSKKPSDVASFPDTGSATAFGAAVTWASYLRTTQEVPSFYDPVWSRTKRAAFRNGIDMNFRPFITVIENEGLGAKGQNAITTMSSTARWGAAPDHDYTNFIIPDFESENHGMRFEAFWGNTIKTGGAERVALYDVPRAPLASLAAFQHAYITRTQMEQGFAIGNSLASTRLPRDANYSTQIFWENNHFADLSYLINDYLFDDYFLSTAVEEDAGALSMYPAFADVQAGAAEFRNARHSLYQPEGYTLVEEDFTSNTASDRVPETVAGRLFVDGMFNINSTSVDAWVAVLSGLGKSDFPILSRDGNVSWTSVPDDPLTNQPMAAFSRLSHPVENDDGILDTNGVEDDLDFFSGMRVVEHAEIRVLAERIVDQIRLRGPFPSLGAFINRELSNGDTGLMGPLQQAIQDSGLNSANATPGNLAVNAWSTGDASYAPTGEGPAGDRYPFHPNMAEMSQGAGMPGYLLQADILQAIGSSISARSDTFTIRTYGDSQNPITGEIDAEARCELIVQRVTEPSLDSDRTLDSLILPESNSDPAAAFGRQFRVLSFRWLSASDI